VDPLIPRCVPPDTIIGLAWLLTTVARNRRALRGNITARTSAGLDASPSERHHLPLPDFGAEERINADVVCTAYRMGLGLFLLVGCKCGTRDPSPEAKVWLRERESVENAQVLLFFSSENRWFSVVDPPAVEPLPPFLLRPLLFGA
jgi:hypothetical protein